MDLQEYTKPIPSFYCCYLLRSTVRHASMYIGSTPDPARRLTQHNGLARGGAHRTAREKLRPWEMVMIVNGFMSRVGALQFEWAWQNTERSRHNDTDDEGGHSQLSRVRICPRTGREKPRAKRTRSSCSLTDHLAHLHALLRSTYFSSWPLEVRFFSADVFKVWSVWSERVDGVLPGNIRVVLDLKPELEGGGSSQPMDATGMKQKLMDVDIGYSCLKEYVEKSEFLFADGERINCGVCRERLDTENELAVVCSQGSCRCASHMLCLSTRFLNEEKSSKMVPAGGTCPGCKSKLDWPTLMKEVSLRTRGQNEIRKMRKTKRKNRKDGASSQLEEESDADTVDHIDELEDGDPFELSVLPEEDENGDSLPKTSSRDVVYDTHDEDSNDDLMLSLSDGSDQRAKGIAKSKGKQAEWKAEIVIEDTDWEDAEIID